MIDYRFVVSDEDGELRRFATKVDAKAFMESRPYLKLTILPPSKAKCKPSFDELVKNVGECLF